MSEARLKTALRARFRAEGKTEGDAAGSGAICAALLGLPELASAACVMGYLAIGGEPDVDAVLSALVGAGRRVCVPGVDWERGAMEPVEFGGLEGLVAGRHGVREPVDGTRIVPIEKVCVVLVPGVAFDARGARLGRGGGFYDRFLARLGPGTIRIGVGFERRVVERLPTDPWDRGVGLLVTERAVRRFLRAAD